MKIAIACDHGAFALKETVNQYLIERGHEVTDFGTASTASCHYPEHVKPAARAVADGTHQRGIVLCTTGIGASIAANKVRGVRCALAHDPRSAELTRRHNDSNVLALGSLIVDDATALDIIQIWLDTPFDGEVDPDSRHAVRIGMLEDDEI